MNETTTELRDRLYGLKTVRDNYVFPTSAQSSLVALDRTIRELSLRYREALKKEGRRGVSHASLSENPRKATGCQGNPKKTIRARLEAGENACEIYTKGLKERQGR